LTGAGALCVAGDLKERFASVAAANRLAPLVRGFGFHLGLCCVP
jgi:hypothetical protein